MMLLDKKMKFDFMMDKDEEYADVVAKTNKDDEIDQGKKNDKKKPDREGSDGEDDEHEFEVDEHMI